MITKKNLYETTIINVMVRNRRMSPEEMEACLQFLGIIEYSEQPRRNFIRQICIAIDNAFKPLKVRFFTFSPRLHHIHQYQITDEAKNFCYEKLQQEIYDENGEKCGTHFAHPISLQESWRQLQ